MKAVFSGRQMAHAPANYLMNGNFVAFPDSPERARRLLQGARSAGAEIYGARRFETSFFASVHTPQYMRFLEKSFGEWKSAPGTGDTLMPNLRLMLRNTVRPKHILAQAGTFMMDSSCPIQASTWSAITASAMTALTAADLVMKGERAAYALCRPPGHHAYPNRASGFCYLNNTALAAQHLRSKYEKVAIIDIDLHHGNGTQAIFYERADVFTASVHVDPNEFFPFFWGSAGETGQGAGEGFNMNVPVPVKAGDGHWVEALEQVLEAVGRFAPGVLVVALGLDAHELDPMQGGAMTTAGFAQLAERISALGLPSVIVQEGGYVTDHLADNLAMFLVGFEGGLESDADKDAQPDPAAGEFGI